MFSLTLVYSLIDNSYFAKISITSLKARLMNRKIYKKFESLEPVTNPLVRNP